MLKVAIAISTGTLLLLVVAMAHFWGLSDDLKAARTQAAPKPDTASLSPGSGTRSALPPDVEAVIVPIEDQLRTEASWPKTAAEIQSLNDRLGEIVGKLPPQVQEELLPRLLPRRWEINALWILANEPSADVESLSRYVRATEAHLSDRPQSASHELEKRLETKKRKTMNDLASAERIAAIDTAKRAKEQKRNLEIALRGVSVYDDEEAMGLAKDLSGMILIESLPAAVDGVRSDLTRYRTITDPSLKAYAVARVNQAVMEIRLRLLGSGVQDANLDRQLGELERDASAAGKQANGVLQSQEAEKLKRYQLWALGEIKKVRTYKVIEEGEFTKIASVIDRNNPASDAASQAKKEAKRILRKEMINYLAPINQILLDEAVSQWFRKVYQQRFSDLDDAEQLAVVEGFAVTVKRPVE